MLLTIVIVVVLLVAGFLGVAALQPAEFSISRRITLAASPATAFGYVNDLQRWQEISPWAKLDPAVQNSFSGPQAGVGAAFAWVGNNKVGQGAMRIIESRPAERVRFQLEFLKPFACTHTAEFTFEPVAAGTTVTWTLTGKNPLAAKAFGLLVNMDKMVGRDFEKGLATLRTLCEAPTRR